MFEINEHKNKERLVNSQTRIQEFDLDYVMFIYGKWKIAVSENAQSATERETASHIKYILVKYTNLINYIKCFVLLLNKQCYMPVMRTNHVTHGQTTRNTV